MVSQPHHHCKESLAKNLLPETVKDIQSHTVYDGQVLQTAITESILTSYITVWFGSATV